MIKTSQSTGALCWQKVSNDYAAYSSLAFIYCVLIYDSLRFRRQEENNILPLSFACLLA